jgi:hypothetical protein
MLGDIFFAPCIRERVTEYLFGQRRGIRTIMRSKFDAPLINASTKLRRKEMNYIKNYQFTLVLKNVDEDVTSLEDKLYEAGCSDALIHFRNDAVYLEFDRESSSIEEAVISAIKDVQSASMDIDVASVAPENLVTESEIANRLDKSRQTVSLWIKGERRKSFPPPVMRVSQKSPLWNWHEVVAWLFRNELVNDDKMLEEALFFFHINAVLEERDTKVREIRHHLLKRLSI